MGKLFKLTSLLCTFAFVFFCFSGCDLKFSLVVPGGTANNPAIDRYTNGISVVDWDGSIKVDSPTSLSLTYEQKQGVLNEFAEEQGMSAVRTLSVPAAGATSGASQTDAERNRFYSNVIEQYEVVAKYILTTLVGNFGMGSNATSVVSNTNHTFNTDLRAIGDYSIAISPATPVDRSATFAFDSNEKTIDRVLVGWEIDSSNPETPSGTVLTGFKCEPSNHDPTPVYSTEYAWTLNLSDQIITNADTYLTSYLNRYLTFVTMRIMEIDLGLNATPFSAFDPTNAKTKIWNYVVDNNIKKLGTNLDACRNAIKNMINTEVVGQNALNYDSSTKTFAEPSFVADYTYETGGDPPTATVQVTHFADINKNNVYNASFTVPTSAGFYCDFESVVDSAVQASVDAAVNFPAYYAMEVTDFSPDVFYDIGEEAGEGELQILANLPYAQYQSIALLCENEWQFDTIYMAFSASSSFVLGVYLRIVVDGNEQIVKISNININHNSSWGDIGDQPKIDTRELTDDEILQITQEQALDSETQRNFVGVDLHAMLTNEQLLSLDSGKSNSDNLKDAQYSTSGTNRLGYHTNAVDNVGLSPVEGEDDSIYVQKEIDGKTQFVLNEKNSTFYEFLFVPEDDTEIHAFTCIIWTEFFGGEPEI